MGLRFKNFVPMVNTCLGTNYTAEDLLGITERIWNLERLFNLREGFTREDDTLPPRFSQETLPRGHSKNQVVDLEPLLEEYYSLRSWDPKGIPTRGKLEELGLRRS